MLGYILTGVIFVVYSIGVWFLAPVLKLAGNDALIFRLALILIGLLAAVIVLVFLRKRQAEQLPALAEGNGLANDVDFVVREANNRLRSSAAVRQGGRSIAEFPLVLVIGEQGSAKTTTILHSGLTPELLSGQVGQDGAAVPTNAANIWLGGNAVLAEAGGPLLNDNVGFTRLVQMLAARRLGNWFGKSEQAPRAVVVCVDTAAMAGQPAAVTAAGKRVQEKLGDVAQRWGSRLPVYVLFTKADQVSYFADYLRNFGSPDVEPVFGAALPLSADATGVYNEAQAARLTNAYEELFYSLADKRADQLRRENDATKLPNIYEFPREFRKLRDNVVRFLVEAGRPSQLRSSAFLRGFYFTGVRPIVADAPLPAVPIPAAAAGDGGATRIFSGAQAAQMQQQYAARSAGTRRVPQWVFLRQLFVNAILGDSAALGTSGADAQANVMRRVLLSAVSLLLLIWIAGSTVSWFNNRALINKAETASKALTGVVGSSGRLPSADAMQRLEEERSAAAEITRQYRDGADFSYRWGLFGGERAYNAIRAAYCRDFGRIILSPTRGTMEQSLASLRTPPQATDQYDPSFNALKAYLMMTSHPAKTDSAFLTNQLTNRWAGDTHASETDANLAKAHFAFYSAERSQGFCDASVNPDAVDRARNHLWGFQPSDRVYRNIIDAVNAKGVPLRFRDPGNSVIDSYEVPFAFSRDGWGQVQKSIRDASQFLSKDPWVLGEQRGSSAGNSRELEAGLRTKYQSDFATKWNEFLNAAAINRYANLQDAANKLNAFTAPQPPLLVLFCMISSNTAITAAPELATQFKSFQQFVDPTQCKSLPAQPPTVQYASAMNGLKAAVDSAVASKSPDATIDGSSAKIAARTSAQTVGLPARAEKLMQDPIIQAEALAKGLGPQALNGSGSDFCKQTAMVFGRFPFDPRASEDAKLEDVVAVLAPNTGKLFQFVQQNLQEVVIQTGPTFAPKSGAKIQVSGAYLAFLNRAAAVSRLLFAANPQRPAFNYTVQGLPSPGIDAFTFMANGKTYKASGQGGQPADFQWTGNPDNASLAASVGLSRSGVWAMPRVLASADRKADAAGIYEFDIKASIGNQGRSGAANSTVKLRAVTAGGTGVLSALGTGCIARVAQ